jgi:ATP synthase protein I
MSDQHEPGGRLSRDRLSRRVGSESERKMRARRRGDRGVWFGLGMFGIVGWSVAIPTLLGIALGVWIDTRWPDRFSWTLMLLFAGIFLGCLNAWYWVNQEQTDIEREEQDDDLD